MNGDSDLHHRSSSPLKRRASSMDPENDAARNRDIEMATSQVTNGDKAPESSVATLPRAMSVDPPESSSLDNGSAEQPPPLLEQVKIIETLLQAFAEAPLKDESKAYIVSRSWVNKALALRGDPKASKKEVPEGPLGPVDNSDIIEETLKEPNGEEFVRLKAGTGLDEFELFPEDAWNMVVDWYGIKEGQQAIVRCAINTADAQSEPNILYEFHPPIFRIHRLWSELSPIPIEQSLKASNPPVLVLSRSRKYHAQSFIKELKTYTGVSLDRKIRLFMIPQTIPVDGAPSEPRPALTPPDSPGRAEAVASSENAWSKLLIDLPTFSTISDGKVKIPLEDQTTNNKFNGKSSLQLFDLVTDQTLLIDEQIDSSSWVSNYTGKSRGNERGIPTRSNGLTISSAPASGRTSPGGPFTRGRTQKKPGRSLGAVGLSNLGNTCYMNSALQCVRSVEELTKYFLTGDYVDEINKTNRLGYNGKIAMTYGNLLKEIYMEGKGSVSPRDFKTTVGRCRSTFSGWGQQDSQEFLGFLLDGLQEDLSRIKEKPYIEKPDSTDEMINDPDAIREMADKVWDITRKRDDSVIADLFTGMYKSTLKCPECGKVSITFDPFNNLTLPLPVEDMWSRPVKFFPLNDVPVNIEVDLPKHSAIEQLFQYISTRTGVPANRLIGGEEFKDRFFKIYDPTQDLSEEITKGDIPTIHELEAAPTNWPGKARPKYRSMLDIDTPLDATEWDDPRYERMAVPVFHRRPNASGRSDGASPPHFILLTREESSDIDVIRRKVLEKAATFSTWSKLRDFNDVDGLDPEMVITSTSDADSSGDTKIVAQSIEGEDDIVDVTMKGTRDRSNSIISTQPKILKQFNTQRPKFTSSDGFLDPELQNLFDLSYFKEQNDGHVATGWQTVDQYKTLPKVSDRLPEPSVEEDEEASPESWNSTASNEDESTNDESSKGESTQTRMMDESSEEDLMQPSRLDARPAKMGPGGRKKFKNHKTYSKKGNKRREKQMRGGKQAQRVVNVKPQPTPPGVADGGPLIRLGEGLVVDWNEDAWEKVFGGSPKDSEEEQGTRTFVDLDTLHDPALKITQRRRIHRRTRGITLEECLDEFERAEILSEQDMWYCPRCKEHRRASKKFDLWKTPDILVCHLKRFTNSGWRRDKLDVLVDFPIEGLDLTTRVIQKDDGKDEIYDLIAVDDHYGGLGGGHYTAYAKNFVDGRWYNYNDSSVSPVSDPASAITNAAYLLFYRRRSSGPLGGSRFEQIFEKFEDSEADEENESGEEQRLVGGSSLVGSSSAGTGAVATHRQADRGLGRTTVTEIADPDADDEDDLPPYGSLTQGNTVQYSIEDEGIGMGTGYQPLEAKSLSMAQGWNFSGLGSEAEDSMGANCASDEAQPDSSADERGLSQNVFDDDVEMTGHESAHEPLAADETTQLALSDIQKESWEQKGVISVPAAGDSDHGSSDVAEIHLDGDRSTRTA